ncbi:hypothetical protein JJJ17_03465 [Paracoccus caeni]|uniref:Uncharacterized protein n=1 Tax=Paracoccus caeni TaxID=657651 RepID=A0A934VTQ5_9RHOB|nr:hypothetical protein [Paracoccus caeni]MBK4214981.1 hypothetical protein [Paracoccus caeni]
MKRAKTLPTSLGFALTATIMTVLLVGGLSSVKDEPRTLSLNFGAHPAVPTVMQMSLNGRVVVEHSQKGQNESGPIEYVDGQGDALDFKIEWYDILDNQGYIAAIRLRASDLSIIGDTGHAAVKIILGPGADVTVTTTNAKAAALIRERRGAELASVANEPDILLAELCADRLAADDPILADLKQDAERLKDTQQRAYNKMSRQSYLDEHGVLAPRCTIEG